LLVYNVRILDPSASLPDSCHTPYLPGAYPFCANEWCNGKWTLQWYADRYRVTEAARAYQVWENV
jgi:hypothetical protein